MFKDSTVSNNISTSLQHFIDDLFINEGAYFDINNTSGYYGNLSVLTKLKLPQYTDGRVWGSRRQNWIWEPSGINISGVWVNNVLVTSGYQINYRDGYILFNTPVSGSVKLNYSFKYIEVKNADDTNFLRPDLDSFNISDSHFLTGSGFAYDDRTQLPCISVETKSSSTTPYEIGSRIKKHTETVTIHVITEDGPTNNKIRDKIHSLEETYIKIFDVEKTKLSGFYPLSRDGFLVTKSGTYNYLADNFKYDKSSRSDVFVLDISNEGMTKLPNGLSHGTLKLSLETILSV